MKRKLWIILALAALAALLCCGAASAAIIGGPCGANGDNVYYSLNFDTGELTISGTGEMATYGSVSSVPWYGNRDSITSLVIESGVTKIGRNAFFRLTNITHVEIPSSVTYIDTDAFGDCSGLTSVTIPASVTTIGYRAFGGCENLAEVTILNRDCVIGDSSHDVFDNCAAGFILRGFTGSTAQTYAAAAGHSFGSPRCGVNVTWDLSADGKTLTVSGTGAMASYDKGGAPWYEYKMEIGSVVMGNGVTRIGSQAFVDCAKLSSVSIPNSVTIIGSYAFGNCDGLTDITIPNSVTSIDPGAFSRCHGLTSVTIPDSVTNIGYWAFIYCSGLTSVTIPDSVTKIGSSAFYGCSGLTSMTIPASVTNIDKAAFRTCTKLTSVTILNPNCTIGDSTQDVFIDCASGFTLRGWANSTAQTYAQNAGITFDPFVTAGSCGENLTWLFDQDASELIISGTGDMTQFGSYYDVPWYGIRGFIRNLSIAEGVTSVSKRAFYGCTALTKVTVPASVSDIGFWAFRDCTGLTEATILNPDCVIGDGDNDVFQGCITPVLKGWSGSTAETYAGYSNSNVTFQSLGALSGSCGDSVTWAFDPLTGTLTINGTGPMWNYSEENPSPFYDNDMITSVVINSGVTTIGAFSFYFTSDNIASVTIPNTVTSIGYCALYATPITSINIPDSVTYIGNDAFRFCRQLTSVSIPHSVTIIGQEAFQYCSSLATVTIYNPDANIKPIAFSSCSPSITLYGWPGSTAETYAQKAGYSFDPFVPAPDLILPASLNTIEDGAFQNVAAQAVLIPKSIQSISLNAFADSGVLYIYGFPGTAAETLAESDPVRFMFLSLTDAWYARLTN